MDLDLGELGTWALVASHEGMGPLARPCRVELVHDAQGFWNSHASISALPTGSLVDQVHAAAAGGKAVRLLFSGALTAHQVAGPQLCSYR